MQVHPSASRRILWLEWTILIAIVALATFLRYWRIEEVPPGFNSDEAVGAMGALTTLREGLKYAYEGQGGAGALGFYFAATAFYLFGPSIATMRGLVAWAGAVSIFANYWAVREVFRIHKLNQARWLAGLSTLGMAVSLWHLSTSRVVFAGIGVPFLMLPSVYFLWLGLNKGQPTAGSRQPKDMFKTEDVRPAREHPSHKRGWELWPFVVSGIFLGGVVYIYLSGAFAPPFYAAFFITQWLLVKFWQRIANSPISTRSIWLQISNLKSLIPPQAYLTSQFWRLFTTAFVATLLLLPMIYVLLARPDLEAGTTRAGQAFFLNPQINQGDPWGLLWRSFVGNFAAYGISPSWLIGQPPRLSLPTLVGLFVFLGFLIALWHSLRGRAAYLFILLWFVVMLFPSILSPDVIPHTQRTIGATTPVYVLAAIFVVWLFETLWTVGRRRLQPRLGQLTFNRLAWGLSLALALTLAWGFWQISAAGLYGYFYTFPQTNEAKAAYHVYAVEMAEEIKRESRPEVAFILPRNTAAGDINRNFTVDFLTELAQPPAAHYWVIDNEETLAADLTAAAAKHTIFRVVKWKTSKHTGADPKQVIPYYLEKYGHYERSDSFEYFDIDTYLLEMAGPDFSAAESQHPLGVDFGGQLRLTGYALGDAGEVSQVTTPQAHSHNLLWLRLAWQKMAEQPENLKVSARLYGEAGQLVTQIDKLLLSNILQVGSAHWPTGAQENTYFLIPIPPATPPGDYTLRLAVYGEESQAWLPVTTPHLEAPEGSDMAGLFALTHFAVVPAKTLPDLTDLKLALPVKQEVLPGLTLAGFETLPGQTIRSGDQIGASLIWQAGAKPLPAEVKMSLSVKPAEGGDEWPLSEPVGLAGTYPTRRWQPGELLRGWLTARIPPALEPGGYKLYLHLTPAGQPGQEMAVLPIGDFQIEGWPRRFDAPQPQFPVEANFNGQATLMGFDLENSHSLSLSPGDTLNLKLYWRAEAEFDRNYTAFVHLLGPDGALYGQVDQTPGAGAFPTTGWLPGEYLSDPYAIAIAPNAPPGDYQIEIGMYDPNTNQRLPTRSLAGQPYVDNRILLPGPTVK